jgi:hypothetical protein
VATLFCQGQSASCMENNAERRQHASRQVARRAPATQPDGGQGRAYGPRQPGPDQSDLASSFGIPVPGHGRPALSHARLRFALALRQPAAGTASAGQARRWPWHEAGRRPVNRRLRGCTVFCRALLRSETARAVATVAVYRPAGVRGYLLHVTYVGDCPATTQPA